MSGLRPFLTNSSEIARLAGILLLDEVEIPPNPSERG
jgi:hypothetical protein